MSLPDFSYTDGPNWRPLPEWMRFFLQLGRLLVEVSVPNARLIVGVTVPTRAYAAVLASTGVVLARADLALGPSRSASNHFDYLASLPLGTSVSWHTTKATKKVGWTAGVREFGGRRLLMIQTQPSDKGGLTESCDERACWEYNQSVPTFGCYRAMQKASRWVRRCHSSRTFFPERASSDF